MLQWNISPWNRFLFPFCALRGSGGAVGTVRRSNSGTGNRFSSSPDRLRDPPSLLWYVKRLSFWKQSGWGVKLTTRLHLVPKLRTSGVTPPLPHKSSWRVEGKLYFIVSPVVYWHLELMAFRNWISELDWHYRDKDVTLLMKRSTLTGWL
jgi:hypothetical protein